LKNYFEKYEFALIDLSDFASGVYFIQLKNRTTKETVVLKFVKQ